MEKLRQAPPWLARVREILDTSPRRPPRLTALARLAAVHPVHLGRVFRAHVGCSPGAYAQRLRVAEACRLLRDTDLPLARVALQAGFFDQSHFTRMFRARMGRTPGAFRASNLSKETAR